MSAPLAATEPDDPRAGARRSGYDGRVARARHIAAGLAVALALGAACRGPSVLTIGTTKAMPTATIYLSPNGFDDNCCATQDAPWKTFRKALQYLKPGSTLVLEDGTYDGATTGYLNIRCDGATADAGAPTNGVNGTPITVTAEHPGLAFLNGDGNEPPLTIDACQYWSFSGLRVEALGAGAAIDVGPGNLGLTFTGMLVANATPLLHIDDGSNDVTVEDSEFYDFHDAAITASRTDELKLMRNYINARATGNAADGGTRDDGTAYGILLEETSNTLAANNVIEGVDNGIGVMGRDVSAMAAPVISPPSAGIEHNRLYGNIVLQPMALGIRIDSRCSDMSPTLTMPAPTALVPCPDARIVKDTDLENDVVIGGDVAVSSAGAVDTVINELTAINAANGVLLIKEPQNAGFASSTTTTNSLVVAFEAEAFEAIGEDKWSFDHCAVGETGAKDPSIQDYVVPVVGGSVTNKVTFNSSSDLQGCRVYLPAGSSLKTAGAGPNGVSAVGANVIDQYADDGTLSQAPLWTASDQFPCGAVVTDTNGDPDTSCRGVGTRLDVGPACPPPTP